jgi:Fe-S-cluster-containing dehydrogenase component
MGCRSCLEVCPYGAPQFYDDTLKLCDLCMHRLAVGKCTACEATCPARAIHVGTTDEISAMAAKKAAERAEKEI